MYCQIISSEFLLILNIQFEWSSYGMVLEGKGNESLLAWHNLRFWVEVPAAPNHSHGNKIFF